MRTVAYLLQTQRAWLRSWLGLALLLAVVGGGVLAVGAGARRTDTAYPRFLASSDVSDVFVGTNSAVAPNDPHNPLPAIGRLPEVQSAAMADFLLLTVVTPGGFQLDVNSVTPIAVVDPDFARSLDRFKVLQGRLADPGRADEVTVSFPLADDPQAHLRVGDTLTVRPVSPQAFSGPPPADGIINRSRSPFDPAAVRTVRVTGIVVSPVANDFPPLAPLQRGNVYFTPAFARQNAANMNVFPLMAVKLHRGAADLHAFEREAQRLVAAQNPSPSQDSQYQQLNFLTGGDHVAVVQSTIHVQAVALGLLAALAALVLLLVLAQGVARRILLDSSDNVALRALGATSGQLWTASMLRVLVAAAAGACGAVAVAVALSPLTPIGSARDAEPSPGVALDAAIVVGGAAALLLLLLLFAAVPAWRAAAAGAAQDGTTPRGSRLAELLARAGFPAAAVAGVRFALEPGRGRTAVPVRSAITACILAAATVGGALTFTASIGHLADSPRLYGWNWDADTANLFQADVAARTIASRPWVGAVSTGTHWDVDVDNDHVAVMAMEPVKGALEPVLLSGRAPQSDGEIVLGSQTDAAVPLGGQVTVRVGDSTRRMRLVGRGVIPIFNDTARLGIGAWMPFGALPKLLSPNPAPADTILVRFAGDPQSAYHSMAALFGASVIDLPETPSGLASFSGLSAMPVVLGGVLAAGAIATLVHAVLTSVRRRRRELAILKTLGFMRGQVAAAVAWQTTTVAAVAALIGAPIGPAAGRWAWTLFASAEGVVSEPVVPLAWLLLLVPAALLLANLVAAIPGRYAARTSPAIVLRAE